MNNTILRCLRVSAPRATALVQFTLAPAVAARHQLQHINRFTTSAPVLDQLSPAISHQPSPSSTASSILAKPQTTADPALTSPQPGVSSSVSELLPLLAAQPNHYITVHIHGKPYLVTPGDSIRLPFKMPGVLPGDVLRLDRAANIGSRDFTLQGRPYVSTNFFTCRATVIGTDCEPMRLKVIKKRRNRRSKTIKSKHYYTTIRISELKIMVPEKTAPAPGYSGSGIAWS